MSKSILIHIGQHKTGTTSIQNWLWGNQKLLSDEGFFLPSTGVKNGAHHALCYSFLGINGATAPAELIADLHSEIMGGELSRVLLSSEEFERLSSTMVHDLVTRLGGFELRPILYIRRQDQYLLSDYGQQVKMGASLPSFSEYLDAPSFPERFNLLGLIGNWVPAGILDRGWIRVYDTLGKGRSVVSSFADIIGGQHLLMPDAEGTQQRSNTSWSYQEVDMMRRVSLIVKPMMQVKSPTLQAVYAERFDELKKICEGHRTPLWPTQEQYDRIRSQFREMNMHAAELSRMNQTDQRCLSFDLHEDRILSEPPVLVSQAEVEKATEIVISALRSNRRI